MDEKGGGCAAAMSSVGGLLVGIAAIVTAVLALVKFF